MNFSLFSGVHPLEKESTKRKKAGTRKKIKNVKYECTKRDSPTVYIRPSYEQMELAVTRNKQGFCCTTPNAEEPTRNVMLLRPKVAEKTPVEKLQPKSGAELQQTSGDDHQDGSGG